MSFLRLQIRVLVEPGHVVVNASKTMVPQNARKLPCFARLSLDAFVYKHLLNPQHALVVKSHQIPTSNPFVKEVPHTEDRVSFLSIPLFLPPRKLCSEVFSDNF